MPKAREPYETDNEGRETHPAFGQISVHRITSTPGEVLFQTDIPHSSYVRIEVREAERNRDLKHDWVFPKQLLCGVSMSEAQFASFVASAGTSGVPCTVDRVGSGYYGLGERPGLVLEPRLQLTHEEVQKAAHDAYAGIQEALSAYVDALGEAGKGSSAARKDALRNLQAAVRNAGKNVDYAAQRLEEHAEEVVEKSRADIEAMIARLAEQAVLPREAVPEIASPRPSLGEGQ